VQRTLRRGGGDRVLWYYNGSTYKTPDGRWTATIIIIISARFRSGSLSRNCHKVGHSYAGKRIFLLLLLSWIVKYDCCVPSLIETCVFSSGYRLPHPPPFSRPTTRIVAGPNVRPSVPLPSRVPTLWQCGGDVGGGPSSTGLRSYILLISKSISWILYFKEGHTLGFNFSKKKIEYFFRIFK